MQEIVVTSKQLEQIKKKELFILKEFDRICRENNLKYSLIYGTLLGAVRHGGFIPWDDDVDVCMLRDDYEKLRKIAPEKLPKGLFYQCHETDKEYYQLFDKIRMDNTIFKEKYYTKYNMHHGIYIDIFPCDNIPKNTLKRKIQLISYQFYRIGLMTRYLDSNERSDIKKYISRILEKFYSIFSMDYLYSKAEQKATTYDKKKTNELFIFADTITCNSTINYQSMISPRKIKFEDISFLCIENYEQYLKNQYGNYMQLPPENERIAKHELVELKL